MVQTKTFESAFLQKNPQMSDELVAVIELDTETSEFTLQTESNVDQPSQPLTPDTVCSECREPLLCVTGRLIGCPEFCFHWIHVNCLPANGLDEFPCRECGGPSSSSVMPRFIVVEKKKTPKQSP